MASIDQTKANENLVKFINNTQKVISLTSDVAIDLIKRGGELESLYGDIPDLLEIGKLLFEAYSEADKIKFIVGFVRKTLNDIGDDIIWDKIKAKDASFLSENLSILLPKNEYVDRIQYAYGGNPTGTIYVQEKHLKNMWKLVQGLIHTSLKYIIFSGNPELYGRVMERNPVEYWELNME